MKLKKVKKWNDLYTHEAVDQVMVEYGNLRPDKGDYWIYLKDGWICTETECGTIHERTKKQCIEKFNNSVKRRV